MESFEITQPSQFMVTVFKFAGLWHNKEPWTIVEYVHSVLVQVPFSIAYVLFMCINLAFVDDLKTSTESLYMTLTELAMLAKSYNLVRKHQEIAALLKKMQSPILAPRTAKELDMYKRPYRSFNRQRVIFVVISISCIVSGYIAAAASQVMKLPFPAWLPFDWKSSGRNYWIGYSYEVLAMTLTTITNASCDLFQAYILFQIALFFQLLSTRLQALGYSDNASKFTLVESMQMHQYIASMAKDAEKILTYPLFFQINVSAIVICFSAFQLTLLSPVKDPGTFLQYFYYMGAMIIEILLPCYYGNEITVQSDLTSTAIYNSNWTEMSHPDKRLIYQFMERLKRPTRILAGGYFMVNLKALMSVIQSAYSLFALIINLEK